MTLYNIQGGQTLEWLFEHKRIKQLKRVKFQGRRGGLAKVWFIDMQNDDGFQLTGEVVKAKQLAKQYNIPIIDSTK